MKRWLLGIIGIIFILSGVASAGGPSFSGGGGSTSITGMASDGSVPFTGVVTTVGVEVKNGTDSSGFVDFFEDGSNGTSYFRLYGPTALAGNRFMLLPDTDGATGGGLYFSSANTLSVLSAGTAYQVYHMGASVPAWTSTLGATGTRLTKIWATDLELTNAPTIGGAAWTTILQPLNATLTAIAAQTESQGALQYYTGDATPAVLAKGTAYQLLQMNSGATAPEWTSSLSISALNLTSATSSIPWVVGTASAPTTEGQAYWNSSTDTLTVGNGSTATVIGAGSGDVTDVGNCSSGNCLDGTSDGGTQILLYDAQGATTLAVGNNSGAVTVTLPTTTGTLALLGANTFTASQTITGDVLPEAANTRAVGGTSAEYNKLYLGDGAIIYGQNDQSNTITSSATGWSFAKPITIADVSNDNYIKITNNAARPATASVNELYPEANVWKFNENGTEYSRVAAPTAGPVTMTGTTAARTWTIPDAAVTIPANPIGGTLGATTNVIPKASGTGTATLQASGITEDGTNVSIGALNLVTTGSIQAGVKISSDANGMSSSEMTAVGLYGTMFFATGAGTWALPTAATGMSFCVYSTTAAAIVINPDDSDDITLNGTLLADGDSITSASGAGDFICMVAIDAVHWYTLGRSGTWTDSN